MNSDGDILREIGRRLESLRKSRGLTQTEAAERSGISRRTLYSAERGENPRLRTLLRLLRTYGALGELNDFIQVPDVSPIEVIEGKAKRRRG